MRAILLIGHGSLRPESGTAMMQLAAQADVLGVAPLVSACFLNYSHPRFAQQVEQSIARGLGRVVAVPYFLQMGGHVAEDLPAIIADAQAAHPTLEIVLAEYLAYDPLLLRAIVDRVAEAAEL